MIHNKQVSNLRGRIPDRVLWCCFLWACAQYEGIMLCSEAMVKSLDVTWMSPHRNDVNSFLLWFLASFGYCENSNLLLLPCFSWPPTFSYDSLWACVRFWTIGHSLKDQRTWPPMWPEGALPLSYATSLQFKFNNCIYYSFIFNLKMYTCGWSWSVCDISLVILHITT